MDIKTMYRNSFLKIAVPTVLIGAVLFLYAGCGGTGESPKSSAALITGLKLSINGAEYSPVFDGDKAAEITLPYGESIPARITVSSLTLSAGATGLANGSELTVTSGRASITVTAEDGTTTAGYTISFVVDEPVSASLIPRQGDAAGYRADDYWTNILPFSIRATVAAGEGEYRLAVRETTKTAPSATEVKNSSATIVRRLSTTPINVFLSFHMDTDFFDASTSWDNIVSDFFFGQ